MIIATGLALQPEECSPPQPLPLEACAKSAEECRIDELISAYSLVPMPKFMLEIATLSEKLSRPADALNAYSRYRRACQNAPGTECVDVKDAEARLKPLTSALQIRIHGGTTRIEVDGTIVEAAELIDPIYVLPGRHKLLVVWERGTVVEQTLALEAGGSGLVELVSPDADNSRVVPVYGITVPPSGCACEVVDPNGGVGGSPAWTVVLTAAALLARSRKLRAEVRRANRLRPRVK